ncbi:MAG: GDSL-type esterase/lipase family protein [Halioglobus sp.]
MTPRTDIPCSLLAAFLLLLLLGCQQEPRYTALEAGTTVLAFGDSVTYGVGADKGEDYPTLLAQRTGWKVVNAGISGDTAQRATERLGALLAQHQPALVLVELGGNDFLRQRQASRVKADLLAILEESNASGAITALIAVPKLSVLRASVGALSDSPIYAELAEETGALLVADVFAEVLSEDALRADQIHPNAAGYLQFTKALLEELTIAGLAP